MLGSTSSKEYKLTDDELLQSFLYNKVHKKPLPTNSINVIEYDLYGTKKNPWEIWKEFRDSHSYDGKDLYFFTTLKKKSATSSRMVRTIGMGSWEGEDTGKTIFSKDKNQPLGLKKRYRFEKSDTYHDGGWILHEYSLHNSFINESMGKDIVLCRFRKNVLRGKDLKNTSQPKQRRSGVIVEQLADATKICNDREDIYQEPINQLSSKDHKRKVIEISDSEYNEEEKDVRNTRQRMNIILAIAAPTKSDKNNNESAKQPNDEEKKKNKLIIETPTEEEFEEENVDNMSFLECFANQLRRINGGKLLEEEDIQFDTNAFNKELLLEYIDCKYMKNG